MSELTEVSSQASHTAGKQWVCMKSQATFSINLMKTHLRLYGLIPMSQQRT